MLPGSVPKGGKNSTQTSNWCTKFHISLNITYYIDILLKQEVLRKYLFKKDKKWRLGNAHYLQLSITTAEVVAISSSHLERNEN